MSITFLFQGATSLDVYFPADTWIDIDDGTVTKSAGESKSVKAPLDKIPVYIRAGAVLPMQMPDVTTTARYENISEYTYLIYFFLIFIWLPKNSVSILSRLCFDSDFTYHYV